MSQYNFHGNSFQFTVGWDMSIKQFFLVIEKMVLKTPQEDPYVFNSLSHGIEGINIADMRNTCRDNGCELPPETEVQLLIDAGALKEQEAALRSSRSHA